MVLRNFVDDEARCLGTRDRFVKWVGRKPVGVGQTAYPGLTGERRTRNWRGSRNLAPGEQTIEARGDPVLQGADEDSWARAVDLEATFFMEETGRR